MHVFMPYWNFGHTRLYVTLTVLKVGGSIGPAIEVTHFGLN